MKTTLGEIGRMLNGRICGDSQLLITGTATLRDAGPGDLTFAVDALQIQRAAQSLAQAVLVPHGNCVPGKAAIEVDRVEDSFVKIAAWFRPPVARTHCGVSSSAWVSPTASLAQDVTVYPGAFIGDHVQIGSGTVVFPNVCIMEFCRIGDDCTLYPGAVLYEKTVVGDRCILHAGCVLGAFGFGYRWAGEKHRLCAQLGHVELGDDVEIGANSTIDRGTYGATRVGDGSKLDDLVMVGHNCRIGRHNLLCSQVGIAGSCTTGDHVVMAGQVGIGDHLTVGERAVLGAKAGVMHDIPSGETFVGIPATPVRTQMQLQVAKARLPEMRRQLKQLVQRIEQLENNLSQRRAA